MGQDIRWATEDVRKLLLTATPLQNSMLKLYGLSTLIDEQLFGDIDSFRTRYTGAGADLAGLRGRLAGFTKRALRKSPTPCSHCRRPKRVFQPLIGPHRMVRLPRKPV